MARRKLALIAALPGLLAAGWAQSCKSLSIHATALMELSIRLVLLDLDGDIWRPVDLANVLFHEPTTGSE